MLHPSIAITTSLPFSRLLHLSPRLYGVIEGYIYGKELGDPNTYTLGRIGHHNVVLAFMPGMGKSHSAIVGASFRSSFEGRQPGPNDRYLRWSSRGVEIGKEIPLSDVIISTGPVLSSSATIVDKLCSRLNQVRSRATREESAEGQ